MFTQSMMDIYYCETQNYSCSRILDSVYSTYNTETATVLQQQLENCIFIKKNVYFNTFNTLLYMYMYLHFTLQASCILYRPVNIHILYISTHSIYNVTYYINHSISSPTIFALCTFAPFHPYLLKLDLYRHCICCCSLLLF